MAFLRKNTDHTTYEPTNGAEGQSEVVYPFLRLLHLWQVAPGLKHLHPSPLCWEDRICLCPSGPCTQDRSLTGHTSPVFELPKPLPKGIDPPLLQCLSRPLRVSLLPLSYFPPSSPTLSLSSSQSASVSAQPSCLLREALPASLIPPPDPRFPHNSFGIQS